MDHIKRFQDSHDFKVDSKFRLSIPGDFRKVLETQDPEWTPESKTTRMVLLYGPKLDGYVEGYSVETISEIQEPLTRRRLKDPKVKAAFSHFVHHATTVTVVETGRFVVPQKIRDKLGLGKDEMVTFLGNLKNFQLWRREDYVSEGEDEDFDFDPDEFVDDLLHGPDADPAPAAE